MHNYSIQDLINYIFDDVKKRIDLGLMWIFNNYLNFKQAKDKLDKFSVKSESDDATELVEIKSDLDRQKTELDLRNEMMHYEYEYDKTLHTILSSLQNRQEPKDL